MLPTVNKLTPAELKSELEPTYISVFSVFDPHMRAALIEPMEPYYLYHPYPPVSVTTRDEKKI